MRQMIQTELTTYLSKSISQIYRKLKEAKIRRELSHPCDRIESIPARQLEPLSKLPPEQWHETWEEVNLTAPEGKVTREHVQAVINRRLQNQKSVLLRLGELVQYPPKDLNWVDAADDTLKDVCDRVTHLWKVPNLPKSAQHLLRMFYQRELIFSQGDMDVLQAIDLLYQVDSTHG